LPLPSFRSLPFLSFNIKIIFECIG
jgi:hypothetical protein